MPNVPDGLSRLARAVSDRRRSLGLTRVQVQERGGPADTTLARIENPTPQTAPPRPTTLRRLDKGLEWPEGSAARTLHDPPVDQSGDQPDGPVPDLANALSFNLVEIPVTIVRDLVRVGDRMIAAHTGDALAEELRTCVQRLTAAYATEVLERVGGPGASMPLAIELTFRAHLAASLAPVGDPARTDQLYRRWLAGNGLPDAEQHLANIFEARWRSKRRAIMLRTQAQFDT